MAPQPQDDDGFFDGFQGSAPTTNNDNLERVAETVDPSQPFKTWIYAPLIAFMLIAVAIVAIQFRRRRRKVVNNLMLREALARDIEAMGGTQGLNGTTNQTNHQGRIFIIRTGANGRPQEVVATTGPGGRIRPTRTSRWNWNIPVAAAALRRTQHDNEGLNELGEAPPPYDGSKDPASTTTTTVGGDDTMVDVPLTEIRRPSVSLSPIREEENFNTTRLASRTEDSETAAPTTVQAPAAAAPATTTTTDATATTDTNRATTAAPPPAYMRYA